MGNPFDIVAPVEGDGEDAAVLAAVESRRAKRVLKEHERIARYQRFLLLLNGLLFLVLATLTTLFRTQLAKAYRAFLNDNLLTQLQREREAGGGLPYYLFYMLFFLSAGFFLFLIARYMGYAPQLLGESPWMKWLNCVGGLVLLVGAKHFVLALLGGIFPIGKEIKLYSFTIVIFSVIMGLVLLLVNLLLCYAPPQLLQPIVWITSFAIALLYGYRSFRGIFIANKFLRYHQFHFLLYICSVEIAPLAVIVKLLTG